MTYLQEQLLDAAKQKYGSIGPCDGTTLWDECFTEVDGYQLLWFNTNNGSTHIIKAESIVEKNGTVSKGLQCF